MATIKRRDRTPSLRGYTVMMIGAAVPIASPGSRQKVLFKHGVNHREPPTGKNPTLKMSLGFVCVCMQISTLLI